MMSRHGVILAEVDPGKRVAEHHYGSFQQGHRTPAHGRSRGGEGYLRHLALHDPLTGIPSRRLLEEHVARMLTFCSRENVCGAMFLIDLDGFKAINDLYGHEAGDLILKHVANALTSTLRRSDLAARLGGDEFVTLFSCVGRTREQSADTAIALAEKLRDQLWRPITFAGRELQVDACVGIRLVVPEDGGTNLLLRDADAAMYVAKRAGRARAVIFEPQLKTQLPRYLPWNNGAMSLTGGEF